MHGCYLALAFTVVKWLGIIAFVGWFLSLNPEMPDDMGGNSSGGTSAAHRRARSYIKWSTWYSFK